MQPDDAQPDEASPEFPEVELRFTYHPPKGDQAIRYERIRAYAKQFANRLCQDCPDSRERSLALTHLEEAVMFANASIARRE